MGLAISGTVPASGCSSSTFMPRAMTCGSSNTCSRSFIGPLGTPAASSASHQSCVVRLAKISASSAVIASRFSTRFEFEAKRGSRARCGQPATSQNLLNRLSLPQARMTSPSFVLNGW